VDPQLDQLEAFLTVSETESFTTAAEVLGVSKSAVSRRVSELEERLGVRLLERTTRQIRLTELGSEYRDRLRPALLALRSAADAVRAEQVQPSGTLRISAPVDFGEAYLGQMCTAFVAQHPDTKIELDLSQRAVDLVGEGFDLALRAGKLRDSSLIARRLGRGSMWICAAPAYLSRRGEPKRIEELGEHEAILFRDRGGEGRWELEGPEGSVEVRVHGRLSGNEFGFVRSACIAGAGIALLPAPIIRSDVASGRFVRVLPAYASGDSDLHVVYPSARFVPTKVTAFRDFAVRWFASLGWSNRTAEPQGELEGKGRDVNDVRRSSASKV